MLIVLCVAACLILLAGCDSQRTAPAASLKTLRHEDGILTIEFEAPAALEQVLVLDKAGHLIQQLPAAGLRRRYELPLLAEPDSTYNIELQLAGQSPLQRTLVTPPEPPQLRGLVEAPFGQGAVGIGSMAETTALVSRDGSLPLGVVVENRRQRPAQFRLLLELPDGVTFVPQDERWRQVADGWQVEEGLQLEFDFLQCLGQLQVAEGTDKHRLTIRFSQWSEHGSPPLEQQLQLVLESVGHEELARLVEVRDVIFPADALGRRRAERLADTVVLANPVWSAVRRWFRSSQTLLNYHDAYAYQSLVLTNRSKTAVNLLVESEVLDPQGGEPLLDFAPPVWVSPFSSPTSQHLLRIDAGQTATAKMPLYVRREVSPGRYERRLRVSLVGSREPLFELSRPLLVHRGDPLITTVALVSLAVAVAGWILFAVAGNRLISVIGTEGLATIALVGALHFVVSYAARIGGDLLAGVMGPFYIFVAGLGSEAVASLLLAATVVLIPRVGTFTLASLTVFVLNALFTGQFGLVDVLFVSVSAACGETCLILTAVTSAGHRKNNPAGGWGLILRMAIALGVANFATLTAQYCLIQMLYRLYFAAWYVAAVSLITGLLYGAVGAGLGTVLGSRLRRTAR